MKEQLWEFIKERRAPFIIIIGVILFGVGSFGVIPIGANPPFQVMDITGRIAFWVSGGLTFVLGIILFIRETSKPKGASIVPIYPRHRITAQNFYEDAFSSGEEVLYVSIMSQSTLKAMEPKLQRALTTRTTLQVLTLDPDSSTETIETIRRHLNENADNPAETVNQIKRAWEQWIAIESRYPNVKVRKYKSASMLQVIIVGNKYAIVELMPYNTHPLERPGLVITHKENPELFKLFQEKYLRLWKDVAQ